MRAAINYIGVLALTSTTCYAGFYTGNDMSNFCNTGETDQHYFADNARCSGYIVGVLDSILQLDAYDDTICLPETLTVGQVTKVVKKFIVDNPAKLHWQGVKIVGVALVDAFPCE